LVDHISVTILTRDSQKYLDQCLSALSVFDEIVVLDNGSSDETLSIAAGYPNVTIVRHEFIGFGPLKNLAIEHARHDWVLSIDSDEIATPELVEAIRRLNPSDSQAVYSVPRANHYNGRPIRCCGWHPDRVWRLFNRQHTRFSDHMVHESLLLHPSTRCIALSAGLNHFPFDSAEGLIEKMQKYSTLYAQQSSKGSTPAKAFFRALFAFVRNYFFQKGFLYGYEGLLISLSNANGVFYKYIKLYEKTQKR